MNLSVFRSYGDLIILLNVLDFFIVPKNFRIYLPQYYKDLVECLRVDYNFVYIDEIKKVPAIYNIRKSSFLEIVRSLIFLRNTIKKFNLHGPSYDIRDFIVYNKKNRIKSKNVYNDYYIFFKNFLPLKIKDSKNFKHESSNIIKIFPYSSRQSKDLTPGLIQKLLSLNFKSYICYYANDKLLNNNNNVIVYNNFSDLCDNIRKSTFIITCDSLSMHLAFFYHKRCFCIIRERKSLEWLPFNFKLNYNYVIYDFSNEDVINIVNNWIFNILRDENEVR